jgi:probable phosphoglycerate mutase
MRRQPLLVTLIRHGQSVSNTVKRFGSQNNVPLSNIGRLQASLAGEALANARITRIITSDLSRASDTANAIGERTGINVELAPALRERDVGKLTGLTFAEAQTRHPDAYADLLSGDPTRKIGGGESYADVARRVDAFLRPVFKQTEGHLVLVSHMVVLTHLLRKACGVDERSLRGALTFAIENTAFHRLSYDRPPRNHWHIFAINETAHLKSLQADDQLGQPE